MKIRSFQEADYSGVTSVWNATHPNDIYTVEEFRYFDDSIQPPQLSGRFVAELAEKVVGVADYLQFPGTYHPQKFFLRLYVSPDFEMRGLGTALYAALIEHLQQFDPIGVRGQVAENLPHALAFAQKRGFVESKRDWESVLELSNFDPAPYDGFRVKLEREGIRFKSIAEFGNTPDLQRRFHALFSEVRQDVPRSEPATPFSFDAFKKMIYDAPDFYPEGTFLAFYGEEAIGLTILWKGAASTNVMTGLTAVKRAYRGRGIATALKVASLTVAKANGATKVITDNDTNNVEMIAINEKLGFVKQPALLSLVKVMKDE